MTLGAPVLLCTQKAVTDMVFFCWLRKHRVRFDALAKIHRGINPQTSHPKLSETLTVLGTKVEEKGGVSLYRFRQRLPALRHGAID